MKAEVRIFVRDNYNCEANYSGKTKTFYIKGANSKTAATACKRYFPSYNFEVAA